MDDGLVPASKTFQGQPSQMDEMVIRAGIIVLALHNENLIMRVCNKVDDARERHCRSL